ncbi:5-formyltetrahydrofolate cyclo-ligase [Oxalobacteraceae bacterium OM1]|nr:5-formyltetrahydrofolate cyclo-ligase [Oxalobacteraceae bacterium OM1]
MPEVSPSKAELRRQLLAHRQSISAEVRREWDIAIGRRVLAWWNANPVAVLGVYWPIRSEPDLRPFYDGLAARGARLALPLVAQVDAPLQFHAWQPGDTLIKDSYGVMVPADGAVVHPDALLIPCVGFNAGNIRLGYGGGFYDRTLASAARPLAVGVAYALARRDFPGDAHDVALDAIITETSPDRFAPLAR